MLRNPNEIAIRDVRFSQRFTDPIGLTDLEPRSLEDNDPSRIVGMVVEEGFERAANEVVCIGPIEIGVPIALVDSRALPPRTMSPFPRSSNIWAVEVRRR